MVQEKKTKKPSTITNKTKQLEIIPKGYKAFLEDLKAKIRSSQIKAAVRVNSTLIELYWQIGRDIVTTQEKEGWGTLVIERLAKDLQNIFPGIQGFSRRNLFYMRKFAESYQDLAIVQQVAALIPWGHNMLIMDRVQPEQRLWYSMQTVENGWSRSALEDWIKSDLYNRQGHAVTNFTARLPAPQSRLAQEILKDPYNFDFLELSDGFKERELEQGLIDNIQQVLLELGQGFAFIGRQYPITVAGDVHYIDLLFYHTKLYSYIIVELKSTAFDPRDAGQMNFYLSAADDILRTPRDNPSIGLLLCKDKNGLKAEYALRDIQKPIGVSSYETQILKKLPKDIKSSLPSIEEIELELGKDSS